MADLRTHAVFGDIHGDVDTTLKLFKHIGISTDPAQRAKDGVLTIQLGDLLHLGDNKPEAGAAKELLRMFDVVLMGNHEWPLFAPYPPIVAFKGFWLHDKEAAEIVREAHKRGQFRAAYSVGDWLISHAGIHPFYLHKLFGDRELPAKYVADSLNWRMARYLTFEYGEMHFNGGNPDVGSYQKEAPDDAVLFDGISTKRGGFEQYGGIIWGEWKHLKESYDVALELPQIVGHTIRKDARPELHLNQLWNIDVGGKYESRQDLCALLSSDDGVSWHPWLIGDGAGTEENGYMPPTSYQFRDERE